MPAIGWRLADGTDLLYEDAYRLAEAQGLWHEFPPSALRAMEEHRVDGYWLSPSAAGGCPRQRILKITEDYTIPLEKQWTPMVGKSIHRSLEDTTVGEESTERLLSCDLLVPLRDGTSAHIELRGTPDYVAGRKLYDYKTLTTWRNTIPDEHHIIQIQLYYYLCKRNAIEVDELILWYIRQSASKGEIRRQSFRIEPWDIYDIEAIAEELAEPVAWFQKTGELPNYIYDPSWVVCLGCPVKEHCLAHARSLP